MPTYDYVCNACGHEFELFQSMSAPVKRKCPKCGKLKLERLIGTGAGVLFKGSGFYETDYRSDSYRKAAESEKKSAEPAKDTSESSKDKKATSTGDARQSEATPKKSGASSPGDPKSKSRKGKKSD